MSDFLSSQLRAAAGARSDGDAHLMVVAADQLDQHRQQIGGLLRALDLLSEEVLQKCTKIEKVVVHHLGEAP